MSEPGQITSAPPEVAPPLEDAPAPETSAPEKKQSWQKYRPLLALALFAALFLIGRWTGLTDNLDREQLRKTIEASGAWGVLVFIGIFAVGELLHVPGFVFVAGGILAWGQWVGAAWSLLGAVISVTFSFVLVRAVGGQVITKSERPWLKKMLAQLDDHPTRTVLILRIIFWLAPPLNYALALSKVRLRSYVIGSTLGIVPMLLIVTIFFGWLFE